eukprot:scaffold1352_cov180-Amphora_coffeaeformis.AAC.11
MSTMNMTTAAPTMTNHWSILAWEEFRTQRYDVDHRKVLFEFSIPEMGRFGFVGCDLTFWVISFLLLSAECLLNCAFACVIYYFIVPYQKSTRAYLVGYGAVLPLIICSPFVLLDWLPLDNMAFLLCLVGGTATLVMFRCVEAMHDCPAFCQTSLSTFMLYYASALQFQMDETTGRPVTVTRTELIRKLLHFVGNFVQTSLLYSLLMPVGYKLFESSSSALLVTMEESPRWFKFFHWTNIANNFMMACLTSLVLECKFALATTGWENGYASNRILWHTLIPLLLSPRGSSSVLQSTLSYNARNISSGSCGSWYFN